MDDVARAHGVGDELERVRALLSLVLLELGAHVLALVLGGEVCDLQLVALEVEDRVDEADLREEEPALVGRNERDHEPVVLVGHASQRPHVRLAAHVRDVGKRDGGAELLEEAEVLTGEEGDAAPQSGRLSRSAPSMRSNSVLVAAP